MPLFLWGVIMVDMMIAGAAALMLFIGFCIAMYFLHAPKNDASSVPAPLMPKKRPPCMICGSLLEKGMKMKSKEIQRKDDSIVYMYSCPFCENGTRKRSCPLCGKALPADSYLIGRMFMRKNGKRHLRIAGCRDCARKDI